MKKVYLLALILLLSVSLFGCSKEKPQQTEEGDKMAVASLVKDFGSKLQTVSLLAPEDVVSKSIQENYSEFVSPALLKEWLGAPLNAPGRLTSSPWPDRIEILTIERLAEGVYKVQGEIIEITSTERASGGIAAKRPISLEVENTGNRWLIRAITLGQYEDANSIVYQNTQHGFKFFLPTSWKGYVIITGKWEGVALGGSKTIETGPLISIRHPQWTSEKQRQDIPIMIFTLSQWDSLQQEKFHIGAAPIGPRELARNAQYVFALPARYNYAFPTGFEEVEDILEGNPLQAN